MPDYKAMYFQLAARVADAVDFLIEAQRQGENTYIEDEDMPVLSILADSDRGTEHKNKS